MKGNNTTDVFDAYLKAKEAYDAIPKEVMARTFDELQETMRFSCPDCGCVFAQISSEVPAFTFNEPIFCCGKLMI